MRHDGLSALFHWRGVGVLAVAGVLSVVGCAQIPALDESLPAKRIEQLGSAKSLAAPAAAWPTDEWWRTYGDPQLDALIDEALRDSPGLGRGRGAVAPRQAVSQVAGATRLPEVSGNLSLTEEKQSYNYLIPQAALPQGWNDYGQATLNLSWELDFWGKNRSALAAAISEEQAAQAEVAQARLILATSVASAYAELAHSYTRSRYRRGGAGGAHQDRGTVPRALRSELETLGSVRQVESRQAAAQGDLHAIDERIACRRTASRRSSAPVRIGALPSRVRRCISPELHRSAAAPGAGSARPPPGHRRRPFAHRGRGASHRPAKGRLLSQRESDRVHWLSSARTLKT